MSTRHPSPPPAQRPPSARHRLHAPAHPERPTRRHRYDPHVYATDRDRALFRLLGERGVANVDQLLRRYWPESTNRQTGVDRLSRLVAGGFIRDEFTTARRGQEERIFYLARKGAMSLPAQLRPQLITGRPPFSEIAHLLRTGDLLDRLHAKYGVLSWRAERILKSIKVREAQTHQVADFSVELDRPLLDRRTWQIEIDGAYYGKRLAAKVASLGESGADILWVVYSKARLKRLTTMARDYPTIRPVLFQDL